MLDLMSMEERIDARVALILRRRVESSDPDALNHVENDLRDIMGGRIPREIWQQRHLKPGSTLMSPVGRFSVDSLDQLLTQRSKLIQGEKKGSNIFPFRMILEKWLSDHIEELECNYVQAGGIMSDLDSHHSGHEYSHMEVAMCKKDSLLRWLDAKTLGLCEVI